MGSKEGLRLLNAFCLSVLLGSSIVLGVGPGSPFVGSVSVFAFLMAVTGIAGANILTLLLPSPPGVEDLSAQGGGSQRGP